MMSGSQLRRVIEEGIEHQESKPEAVIDQIRAAIDSAAGSVDEHSWTPGRFITVFFPEFYDGPFVNYYGNIILIILGFVLSIIASRDKYYELEAKERGNRSERFIIASLRKREEQRIGKETKLLDEEQKKEIEKDLKEIAKELFNRDLDTTGGRFELKKEKEEINIKGLFIPKWMREFFDNIENEKNTFYKALKLINGFVKNTWNFLSSHSFYYWIIWFFTVFLISSTISVPLGLGLAAIVPGVYFILKLGFYIKSIFSREEHIKPGIDELIVIHVYLEKLKLSKLNEQIKKENSDQRLEETEEEIKNTNLSDEKFNDPEKTFKNIFKRKKILIFTAFISALVSGYIVAVFIQWPLTDLLISVLHVSGIAGSGAFSFSATAIPILFGIALGIGIVLAIIEGIKKHEKIEESRAIFLNFNKENGNFLSSKNDFESKFYEINRLIAQFNNNSEYKTKWEKRIREIPRDLLPDQDSWLEKFRRRFAMFITGAGSGIFIVRSLLLVATMGIVPLFLGTLSWGLVLGVAIAVGVIWGFFKVCAMVQAKEEARELGMIERLHYFKWGYKSYTTFLRNMKIGINADLASYKASSETKLAVRAGPGRESTSNLQAANKTQVFSTPNLTLTQGNKKKKEE